jgi:hypothetical protein
VVEEFSVNTLVFFEDGFESDFGFEDILKQGLT